MTARYPKRDLQEVVQELLYTLVVHRGTLCQRIQS